MYKFNCSYEYTLKTNPTHTRVCVRACVCKIFSALQIMHAVNKGVQNTRKIRRYVFICVYVCVC